MAWLPATLEECLESLGILLKKQAAKPQRHRQPAEPGRIGAASVRCHSLEAECLGILNIPEPSQEASASSRHPAGFGRVLHERVLAVWKFLLVRVDVTAADKIAAVFLSYFMSPTINQLEKSLAQFSGGMSGEILQSIWKPARKFSIALPEILHAL